MPLKNFTETKMSCQKRREGRMGSWLDLVQIVHGRQLESAALLGLPHLKSLGKRIKLALANSLMHYLSSTLRVQYDKKRNKKPWTDPIVSIPQELRDRPKDAEGTQGVTDRPQNLIQEVERPLWLAVRVGKGQQFLGLESRVKKRKGFEFFCS